MECYLCHQYFSTVTFPALMSSHLKLVHDLHFSCDVIARAMFVNPAGKREAVVVMKDFEMRDNKIRTLQLHSKVPSSKRCHKAVQTETWVKEEGGTEGYVNGDLKSNDKKFKEFEEYWEEGMVKQSLSQTNALSSLTTEECELFDKIGKILESQSKKIASLESQLILSKDNEGYSSKETERLREVINTDKVNLMNLEKVVSDQKKKIGELEHDISSYKQIEKSKEIEIDTLRIQNQKLIDTEITLTNDLADVKKQLKENEGTFKDAKSKEHVELARNKRDIFENTRKSINDMIENNRTSANNIINVVTNSKTACKYMVNEVTKKIEEFEAELDIMNNSTRNEGHVDSTANFGDKKIGESCSEVPSYDKEGNNNKDKQVSKVVQKRKVDKHADKNCSKKYKY